MNEYFLPLSAHTPEALRALAQAYRSFLIEGKTEHLSLHDLCYTASVRRDHFDHRLSMVVHDKQELLDHLDAFIKNERRPNMFMGRRKPDETLKLVFVFSGQGPQWWGMGRNLLESEPVFYETVEKCDELIREYGGWSLLEELRKDESSSRIQETAIAQPAIFSLQVALAALWRSWGIEPDAVIGHSVGEVAAAHVAGALSLRDAVHVIFHRGRCMNRVTGKGKMLAVGLPEREAEKIIRNYRDRVFLAAINSPSSVTLSGDPDVLKEIEQRLEEREVFCKFLQVNIAFHSPQMELIRDELLISLGDLSPQGTTCPIISTVIGKPIEGQQFDKYYWWQNVRKPVHFLQGIDWLIDDGYNVFVELSAHPVLNRSIVESLGRKGQKGLVLPSLRRQEERATMLGTLGALYTLGFPVDWQKLWPHGGRCVRLPRYPWQREHYWHETEELKKLRLEKGHPLLGQRLSSAELTWENTLDKRLLPYLSDHKVQKHAVFPATAYIEMGLKATQAFFSHEGSPILEEIYIQKALFLPDSNDVKIQLTCHPDASFSIHSRPSGPDQTWVLHLSGSMHMQQLCPRHIDIKAIKDHLSDEITQEDCYRGFSQMGLYYGPSFQGIERIWRKDGEALGKVRFPEHLKDQGYNFHPAFLDACLQVIFGTIPLQDDEIARGLYLPVQIERVRFFKNPSREVWSHARLSAFNARSLQGDVYVYDPNGDLLMEIKGVRCQAVEGMRVDESENIENWFYTVKWHDSKKQEGKRAVEYIADLDPIARLMADEIHPLMDSKAFQKMEEQLDDLSIAYIVKTFRDLGWELKLGDFLEVGSLMERLGLGSKHRRMIECFLRMLEEHAYLERVSLDKWKVAHVPVQKDPEGMWRSILWQHPAFFSELSLIRKCGSQLPAVLRDQVDPEELLFSKGVVELLEHFYQDSPSFRLYNTAIKKAVKHALRCLPKGRTVRVLEIGAGTGGLTTYILPEFPKDRSEYVFSDCSERYLSKAEQKFRDYPFIKFQRLDIEKDPFEQGYEPHSFDFVLASDVLHTVSDPYDALKNIQKLLSSEGLLILMEPAKAYTWKELVFSLDRHPAHPLTRDQWKDVLQALGFKDIVDLPRNAGDLEWLLMLARGPQLQQGIQNNGNDKGPQPTEEKGSWLIFADSKGIGERLAQLLKDHGYQSILVTQGDGFRYIDGSGFEIAPDDPEAMENLLRLVWASQPHWEGVIHLWSLDIPRSEEMTVDSLQHAEALGCHSIMGFIQSLYKVKHHRNKTPRLIVVTRGAQAIGEGSEAVSVAQSPLIGLGRVIRNEYPDIRCKMIDLGLDSPSDEIQPLFDELWTEDSEEEVALRGDIRFVPRLERMTWEKVLTEKGADIPFRLEVSTPGVLDNLVLKETRRRTLGPGEVEIEVYAASLNFRDVLKALNLYPTDSDDYMMLGDECAGRIVALGEGVEGLKVGDEVVAIAPMSFGSYATTLSELVIPKPAHLTFEEAATMPIVFVTAYYALCHLAKIDAGEKILIQAAAGGVGLAALQIAKYKGAQVFATAGNQEKREFLASLGVQHVMDSRSLSFADEIMEFTQGRGVDVVLNALSGKAIAKGLSCLAPYGRFLEIGKRDIYQNTKLGLWPFRKNLSFFSIDLSQLMVHKPAFVGSLLKELSQLIEKRHLNPLPYRAFPVTRVVDAFRYMAQAKQIGKVVIDMQERPLSIKPKVEDDISFDQNATYLITGGFGGFGLTLAKWLVEHGAQNVVLVSRKGAESEQAKEVIEHLQDAGARVIAAKADVTDVDQVAQLLERIDSTMPPLKGIFHTAMVIDDALLLHLDRNRFRKVMAPKVIGAWNLHSLTLNKPLDFFVLFSSVSSIIGNHGQSNYAAANAFLDTLAHYRRRLGLPATTINWGHLAEVGYASRHQEVSELLNQKGVIGFSPKQAMKALAHILHCQPVQIGVMKMDWAKLRTFAKSTGFPQMLSSLVDEAPIEQQGEQSLIREAILLAKEEDRESVVQTYIRDQVARVLGTSAEKLEVDKSLNELGLDSLMAFELKNMVENELALSLPITELMRGPSINKLSAIVLNQLGSSKSPEDEEKKDLKGRLVGLRVEGSRPPLFFIHPAGGQISVYKALVEALPADQPVYGIQSQLFADSQEEYQSIEDLAHDYAEVIRQQQADGPYYLLGFSLGGFLAIAIANVLERQGQTIAFIGLIDCDLAWTDPLYPKQLILTNLIMDMYGAVEREFGILQPLTAERLAREAAKLSERILTLTQEERVEAITEWLIKRKYIHEDIPVSTLKEYLSHFETHVSLIEHFKPKTIHAPIHLWWAQESLADEKRPDVHWGKYSSKKVVESTIKGNHYSIMSPPSVYLLAEQLRKSLEALS